MKATELRIGNYYNEFGIAKIVDPNLILKLYQIEIAGKIAIDVTPIPLTEEWLLKAGLKREDIWDNGVFEYILYKFSGNIHILGYCAIKFNLRDGIFHFSVNGEMGYDEVGNALQHVHQLQNLYFDLTGNELELK